MYFGFAEGDNISFSIAEINNKEIGKIEITEYPSTSLFKEIKVPKIENLSERINNKAIYIFRISNDNKAEITCKIIIRRVPASEKTKDFNTNIIWIEKKDTTWSNSKETEISYDTTITASKVKKLAKTERNEEILLDKIITLDANGSPDDSDKYILTLQIPKPVNSKTSTKEIIRWTYWIGAGKESEDAYNDDVKKFKELKSPFISPLAGYAIGLIQELKVPSKGNIVEYWIMDNNKETQAFLDNKEFSYLDNGKGIVNYGKSSIKKGNLLIAIRNNSKIKDLKVNVKVVGIAETKTYEIKETSNTVIKKENSKPVPTIKTIKVPTFAQ